MENARKGLNPLYVGVALVATLLIGAGIGFWLRPPATPPAATIEAAVTASPTVSNPQAVAPTAKADDAPPAASPGADVAGPPPPASDNATPTPTIMDFLLADARHFQGESDAPVTMIEFSDFT